MRSNKTLLWYVKVVLKLSMFLCVAFFGLQVYQAIVKQQSGGLYFIVPYDNQDKLYTENFEAVSGLQEKHDKSKVFIEPTNLSISIFGESGWLLAFLLSNIPAAIYFLIAYNLYKMTDSFKQSQIFVKQNIQRVYIIGFSLIAYSLFNLIKGEIAEYYYKTFVLGKPFYPFTGSLSFIPNLFDSAFFVGLLLLVFAKVFSEGLNIKKEQELTI
ncbi:DUF2975 domain-containing protein [Roseivirga pacifica]|uniref:DUF2975 domain-containing protein n=1 Tax=Roseivirga pacifica TaxID=1267423 RepID=UPI00227D4D8D|nr:DUF2975 domain-containing protein [Roseivirga pacifica]